MPYDFPIALQVYSVKNEAAEDLAGVLRQAADWGYDGVEFAGFYGHSAEAVKAMLDETGLKAVSSHVRLEALTEDFEATVSFHEAIGCKAEVVPWLPEERRSTLEQTLQTAADFRAVAVKLGERGFMTGFHAHSCDVLPMGPPKGDGRSPWEIFREETPSNFVLQYDTANGMEGGADPVAPIRQSAGRTTLLHLKEFGDGAGSLKGYDGHGKAAIGDGDVPWADVFAAAANPDEGGTEWLIVEQEGHATLDPMPAAKLCLENLRKLLQA